MHDAVHTGVQFANAACIHDDDLSTVGGCGRQVTADLMIGKTQNVEEI